MMSLTGRAGGGRRHGVVLAAALALGACDAGRMGPTGAADPAEGRLIAFGGGPHGAQTACFTCHGLQGEGDGAATPRLAGISHGYLEKQMHDYALERRPDKLMSGIAKGLTVEQRRAVARHYAALPVAVRRSATDPATAAAGADVYETNCRQCHGEPFAGLGPASPALGGQPAAYTLEQLRRWRLGERRNDPRGVMTDAAQRLSDEDAGAVAAYLASVRP